MEILLTKGGWDNHYPPQKKNQPRVWDIQKEEITKKKKKEEITLNDTTLWEEIF